MGAPQERRDRNPSGPRGSSLERHVYTILLDGAIEVERFVEVTGLPTPVFI